MHFNFLFVGSFYALSNDTNLDTDDCLTVTPCGKLLLHLNKEIYQSLGLEGKPSIFSPKNKDKFGMCSH
jgi:ribonucleases P/MRP protein subunit RPP40